jgi:hypothetical protein
MILEEAGHPNRTAHVTIGVQRLVVPVAHGEVEMLTPGWTSSHEISVIASIS